MTRAEELAEKVRYCAPGYPAEMDAALSELVADAEALAEKYAACQEAAATLAALVQDKYAEIAKAEADAEALAEALERIASAQVTVDKGYYSYPAPPEQQAGVMIGIAREALARYRGEK